MSVNKNIFRLTDTARMQALAGTPLASFTRRAVAFVIDFSIAGFLFLVLTVGIGKLAERAGYLSTKEDIHLQFNFFSNWYSVAWSVLYFTISLYVGKGQTIGKKICRIRVVSLVHDHLGFWHAFERSLGYGASALEAGFGFFQYFLRPDRRTIHDRIGETIVIFEPRMKKKESGTSRSIEHRN
jgi:uncharacterized RDD family membrane protein YckC